MNWNPFASDERRQRKERIRLIEKDLSSSETKMYTKLFELDEMVKRSLVLLGPKTNDDQDH